MMAEKAKGDCCDSGSPVTNNQTRRRRERAVPCWFKTGNGSKSRHILTVPLTVVPGIIGDLCPLNWTFEPLDKLDSCWSPTYARLVQVKISCATPDQWSEPPRCQRNVAHVDY